MQGVSPPPPIPAPPLVALLAAALALGPAVAPALAQRQAYPLGPAPQATPAAVPAPVPTSAPANAAVARPASPGKGLVTIESDRQRADNRTGVITATGNVRIVYPDQRVVATARQAQYFSQEGRVVLSGDVDIVQADGHTMRAERVVYEVIGERLLAVPAAGGQVVSTVRIPAGEAAPARQ